MKTIIITGVSDGLGYQLAKKALDAGYKVVGISRSIPDLKIEHIKGDLTEEDGLNAVVKTIKEKYSKFDVLINCAGMLSVKQLGKVDYEETLKLFKLNVIAPLFLVSELVDLIKSNEADIVNIGSTVGSKAYENQAAYGSSKWAVRGLNANLQLELKNTKCRVIGLNPGGFKSNFFEKATGVENNDWSGWMNPLDIAEFVLQIIALPKNMEVSDINLNRK
ncbi:SDR family oxidoreductase [Candidatus Dojkabacteria bacterium]|jgi:short-subunit dehydrogenase|uniref:SDR family oxidoreductase n=1 Tax=Candidatus Dojkabacteria bacterium TaxID=2099670 RepID=A0A955KZX2_9BACT|nr:SDR family oxidoreductase [Candidatus Dojkabacteria bacterium]